MFPGIAINIPNKKCFRWFLVICFFVSVLCSVMEFIYSGSSIIWPPSNQIYALSKLVWACPPTIYCKLVKIDGYLIWWFLTSKNIDCYLNWPSLVKFPIRFIMMAFIGCYLIWWFLGPSQMSKLKPLWNINHFELS